VVFVTGATYSGFTAAPPGVASATTALTAPPTTVVQTSSSKPAFPGTHGSDPPPPGSGC